MSAKNKWFKHYNTASLGASFERLRAERDFEAMACYWMLLELVSRHETDDRRGEVELPMSLVHKYWNVSTHRAHRIMQQLMVNFAETMRIETSGQNYKLSLSNWSELQENRGGKRKTKSEQNPERGKREEVKRVEVREKDATTFGELFKKLPEITKTELNHRYGEDYVIEHGIAAMLHYRIADPASHNWPPLKWGVVIAKWLGRQTEFDREKSAVGDGTLSGLAKD